MRINLLPFIILVSIGCLPISAQSTSCLDLFRGFRVFEPEVNPTGRDEFYVSTIAWYGKCILIGSSDGLWLYNLYQPDNAIKLARIEGRTISNVAVNPVSQTIAFSITEEPTVYLIDSDTEVSSLTSSGQAVTAISFSPDGSLMAVASSDIDNLNGFYHDARVQIWNSEHELLTVLSGDAQQFVDVFITSDGSSVLTHGVNWGYIGDIVEYWDLDTDSLIWDYSDLLRSLDQWSINDPLAVTLVSARDVVLALGGLDGFMHWDEFYGTAVHIWDSNTQTRLNEIVIHRRGSDHDDPLRSMALSSDGLTLATAQLDGTINLWSTIDGSLLSETVLSAGVVYQLAFSADDGLLSALSDQAVVVLNVEALEEIASFDVVPRSADDE